MIVLHGILGFKTSIFLDIIRFLIFRQGDFMAIDVLLPELEFIYPSDSFAKQANISDESLYKRANDDFLGFWEDRAKALSWFSPWHTVLDWQKPIAKWFVGGTLNASYNCLDVHVNSERKHKTALLWEGEMGEVRELSYQALFEAVNRLAYVLKHQFNIQKGDRVTLYMPLIPELAIGVLACARIGAIHSVIFGGFSATSIKDRLLDSQSKWVITADGGYRRGKPLMLKEIVDQALASNDTAVENVLVYSHLGVPVNWVEGRDFDYKTLIDEAESFQEPEKMDSEDVLFILYSSGTTGKPKGIVHTTGGYLTHAKFSTWAVFDLKEDDRYWCTADIGWITGHTYGVYGPLSNGATVFMYEGAPDYPDKDRFWNLIEKHKLTLFYTAPTAIRSFMKWGDAYPKAHDLSSLRLLGTVGEPINPEAWQWYFAHIGGKKCPIVDTWWQTETGGIMITTLPGLHPMKPGCAGVALPGIEAKVVETEGTVLVEKGGLLTLTRPWPSMLRGIWGDMQRYEDVYWKTLSTYFAGDGAVQYEDGHFMVLGRIDDVLNVAGHRIGTMEVESALVEHEHVAEAAVVGIFDEIKGQAIVAFVTLSDESRGLVSVDILIQWVSESIGPIAKPKHIVLTPELPKTRSGKIMRRLLSDIANGKVVGDVTTLANPAIVQHLEIEWKKLF